MPADSIIRNRSSLANLRKLAEEGTTDSSERCDLCGLAIAGDHEHLFEPAERRIVCACRACSILFSGDSASLRFKRVTRDIRHIPDLVLSESAWNALMIPIGLAFFYHSSVDEKMVAFYPSPAGAVESLLDLENWKRIQLANPVVRRMLPDVEALLVNRTGEESENYIVPIDQCYRLVGLIRRMWRGFSGGAELWKAVNAFFDELREKASVGRRAGDEYAISDVGR